MRISRAEVEDQIRAAAEASLDTFIRLVAPHRVLGAIHEEVCNWWTREDAKDHQLLLLPRSHQKSALIAYRVAWWITKYPETTILYISATSNLAEKQLKAIKDILTSPIYTRYWPDMVHPEEGKREKWTSGEISVDHPKREEEGIRDPTIFTAGLTTTITGMHCEVAVLDDVVVKENAYTEEGRARVAEQYSLLSSIENAGAREWAVGTRYHPKDLYGNMMAMTEDIYDDAGDIVDQIPIYEVFERQVEDRGDGTGEFIWPRQRRHDGKWFGFDRSVLAKKRAQYLDRTQFRAQYYNDPNDPDNQLITSDRFQYFERKHLSQEYGVWFLKNKKLNVFAAIDFAYSLTKRADYTAIVVIGVDEDGYIYVLDIDRFKTDRISEYYEHILQMHIKWGFRKLRAETTAAQKVIVRDLKNEYIRPNSLALSVDEHNPTRHGGTKEERMDAALQPRYDNLTIWHYKGGLCQTLEEELMLAHPPHDDIKDALMCAIDIAIPPKRSTKQRKQGNVIYNSRFGGVGA
jgi:hypothetical protein